MGHVLVSSFPAALLAAWLAVEAVLLARRLPEDAPAARRARRRLLRWSGRPWAAWAVLSLVSRRWADLGFNNAVTFPFYANRWDPSLGAWATILERAASPLVGWWVALAAAAAAAAVLAVHGLSATRPAGRVRPAFAAAVLPVAAFCFWIATSALPRGAVPAGPREPGSLLQAWHDPASTLLYAVPHVRSVPDFLRRFEAIQPALRRTIHGASHPPGAVLSLYGIGRLAGAADGDIRTDAVKIRYALGLAAFGTLNVGVLLLLGRLLTGSTRTGLLAAALWALSPAAAVYATFSQDVLYSVFFNLGLAGLFAAVRRERPSVAAGVLLGAVFFAMTMLSYSWCLVTTIFAVFAAWQGRAARWRVRDYAVRVILPLGVMALLLGATLAAFRMDYLGAYRFARAYHEEWYRYTSAYQWSLALAGGQADLLLMMGSTVCCAFLYGLARVLRRRPVEPAGALLLVVLAVYAIPVLVGPNPLKMETSRCWMWVTSVPMVFAATTLEQFPRPRAAAGVALGVSAATAVALSLVLHFGA